MSVLDRTQQPPVRNLESLHLPPPREKILLPSGAKLTILPPCTQEDLFRLDIHFFASKWRQKRPLESALTNAMLNEGTRTLTSTQIADQLDRYGAWLATGQGVVTNVVCLFSLNRYARETLPVLEQVIKDPIFPQKEFDVRIGREKQRHRIEVRKVAYWAMVECERMIYGNHHPCTRFPQEDDYNRLRPHHLKAFYDQHYYSSNALVYLSGNPDRHVIEMVKSIFGDHLWGEGDLRPLEPAPVQEAEEKRRFIEMPDSTQNAIQMGCLTMPFGHPDFIPFSVFTTLLGGYFGSRLMMNIREDKGYTYGIGSVHQQMPFQGEFSISTQCDPAYVKPVIREIYHEIDRLQQERVTDKELDMVKSYMTGELIRSKEGLQLVDAYTGPDIWGLPEDYLQQRMDLIRNVTPAEIQRLACQYLPKETLKEAIAGKKV